MTVPNGSLIVWMAGLVMGLGAGMVLIYHVLLGSHAQETRHLTEINRPAPVLAATHDVSSEHAQALRDAMKRPAS